ncbi:HesA/MoeB/ThiF family protein [Neobacillus drentensis]|uniref:HesA/MoeB/ThiF family protein n=1 Tax=Neobacillus drentensis TaxID=220684 RepID=UPI002864F364|nr:ThiF family adenylyltransferase [Neobacillus drentensis]MDR7239159.1 molybdopterin/thiamine biosynthesis adenylyltransferase [Neobacillus drentensis]
MKKPKIRSSVSSVVHENNVIEFFLTNTRKQVMMKVPNENITNLLLSLDGMRDIEEISQEYNLDSLAQKNMINLFNFLERKNVIIDAAKEWNKEDYQQFRRVLNFIEDYVSIYDEKIEVWNNIRSSHVVIVGLGAVGTWIAFQLAQSGVKHFTLIDADKVEMTNLHRQLSFGPNDIGRNKIDVVQQNLLEINSEISVKKVYEYINETGIDEHVKEASLVINCADKPTVDQTALWIGESCMKYRKPHIIAGGYNLHLSLIGQTIIPFQSACVKCFETKLNEINQIDTSNLRKLHIENRKIGSFGPMCAISASIAAMEAIKILSKVIKPANINRRGEFDIYSMDIKYMDISHDENCKWCGVNGKYL